MLSHRPIVLTDTIDYRAIGFSHNRPNPNNNTFLGLRLSTEYNHLILSTYCFGETYQTRSQFQSAAEYVKVIVLSVTMPAKEGEGIGFGKGRIR